MKWQEPSKKCPNPCPSWKKSSPTLPEQIVTGQLGQKIHDSIPSDIFFKGRDNVNAHIYSCSWFQMNKVCMAVSAASVA